MNRILEFLKTNTATNVVSVLSLIIATIAVWFSWSVAREQKQFSLVISEDRDVNRDVELHVPKDGNPLLKIPVRIQLTNRSGLVQPVSDIHLQFDHDAISCDELFDKEGSPLQLPRNIAPNSAEAFEIVVPIEITPLAAECIRKIYQVDSGTSSTKLDPPRRFSNKLFDAKISRNMTLRAALITKVTVQFWITSSSPGGTRYVSHDVFFP